MSCKDPYRLQLMKALTAKLEEITIENGYENDLTGKVFRGRAWFGENDPIPMVSVLESPNDEPTAPPPPTSHFDQTKLNLLIQGFVADDIHNPTDPAYRLLADVRKCLTLERNVYRQGRGYNRFGLGNSVIEVNIGIGTCRPPDDVSAKAYFWLPVTLTIAEDAANPYAEVTS